MNAKTLEKIATMTKATPTATYAVSLDGMTRKEKLAACKATRQEKMAYYYAVDGRGVKPHKGHDSGAWSKAREIDATPEKSIKRGVAKQGQPDNRARVDGKTVCIEYKTNGGIVENLFARADKNGYIVYELDINNANTGYHRRHCVPVLMTVAHFCEMAVETGAVRTNSRDGKLCIQPSKVEWCAALDNYGKTYGAFYVGREYGLSDYE